VKAVSIKECIDSYSFRVSEQETIFRDLFGREELKEARKRYYAEHHRVIDYLTYIKRETERKLREQDGD
jgi:hypothetical protein